MGKLRAVERGSGPQEAAPELLVPCAPAHLMPHPPTRQAGLSTGSCTARLLPSSTPLLYPCPPSGLYTLYPLQEPSPVGLFLSLKNDSSESCGIDPAPAPMRHTVQVGRQTHQPPQKGEIIALSWDLVRLCAGGARVLLHGGPTPEQASISTSGRNTSSEGGEKGEGLWETSPTLLEEGLSGWREEHSEGAGRRCS